MSINMNPAMNRRSLIAGVAGLGAAGILAGCSNGGSSDGGSAASSDGAAFKLGTIGPLTGDTATYGVSVTNGVEMGAEDFSTKDFPLTVKKEDSQGKPETAVNAYGTLRDWGMQALVGPTLTGTSVSVSEKCQSDRVFMIAPVATAADVTADKDCVFRGCFTDPNQGKNAAKWLAKNKPDAKIAIIYQSDDAYSQGICTAFTEEAKADKLNLVKPDLAFKTDTATDFKVQLGQAQDAGADLIFCPPYYTPASVILKQASDMGYKFTMMGCDGMDGLLSIKGFDTSLAEGVLMTTAFSADDPANAEFVKAYKDKYGDTPDQFAATAYDCVHAVAEACKKAGLSLDTTAEDACDQLAKAFTEITVDGLTGSLTWTSDGEVSKEAKVFEIQGGKYVAV